MACGLLKYRISLFTMTKRKINSRCGVHGVLLVEGLRITNIAEWTESTPKRASRYLHV